MQMVAIASCRCRSLNVCEPLCRGAQREKGNAARQSSRKARGSMFEEKRRHLLLILAWIAYVAITWLTPLPSSRNIFQLSLPALRLLQLSIAVPYLGIWLIALNGTARFRRFAISRAEPENRKGLLRLNSGLLALLAAMIVGTLASALANMSRELGYETDLATILMNYVYTCTYTFAFVEIFRGCQALPLAQGRSDPERRSRWVTVNVLWAAMSFVSLVTFYTNPSRQFSPSPEIPATYYLPDNAVLFTIILPTLVGWYLGLIAIFRLARIANSMNALLERSYLRRVNQGVAVLLLTAFILNCLQFIGAARLYELGLGPILAVVYGFLSLQCLGFVFIGNISQHTSSPLASYARKIIETNLDPIVTLDQSQRICDANFPLSQLTSLRNSELVARPFPDLFRQPNRALEFLEKVERNSELRGVELDMIGPAGSTISVSVNGSMFHDRKGNPMGIVVSLRDITVEKRSQHALEQARQAAISANEAKSTFLANMSHELRTPLNAIIGYSELLKEEAADQGIHSFNQDLERIRSAGKHLLELINDVLDLSKIEAGKMEIHSTEFEVEKLIRDVQGTIEPLIEKNGNTLSVAVDPLIPAMRSDRTKIRQILLNFLSNAAKFTTKGSIALRVSYAPADAAAHSIDSIKIEVQDNGIGISSEQQSRLFQPFVQAESDTARKYGGTGLGLALSSRFVSLLGGTMAVESTPNVGSTFRVFLPLREVESSALNETTPLVSSDASYNPESFEPVVLLIDDDPNVADLVKRVLRSEQMQVVTAHDGEEGVRLARHIKPDLILLDILMPKMDGWTVLALLRADSELAETPIMICTVTDDRELALSQGVADFLIKPVTREMLVGNVRRVLGLDGQRILVIEDEDDQRIIAHRVLSGCGFEVSFAENGKVALEALRAQPPDLILLDLLMPVMDGFEFLEALAHEPAREIPVVVMTSKDLSAQERTFLNKNVVRTLSKRDFSATKMRQTMMSIAAKRRADSTATRQPTNLIPLRRAQNEEYRAMKSASVPRSA
jgi:PAS domain S-box-containing protein